MQERSLTLPMCTVDRTSHLPLSSVGNISNDTHSSTINLSNDFETTIESSTSTPELNLLLDKLTEILRFRSNCRRHFGVIQPAQQPQSPTPPTPPQQSSEAATVNLKRLQSSSIEPLHNTGDTSSLPLNGSLTSTGAWKSLNNHHKSSNLNRSSHYHHHHHKHHINVTNINNIDKKRRLPSLLQRLIDEGNLIKEAVRRLKTQRFSHAFKQQQQQSSNVINTPSTPTSKTSNQTLSNITSRLTPSSSININIPQQLNDSPTQITSSPNRSISWFLSSSVFGVNASTTNHSSGSGSPLRTCYSSSTHDRTPMEIGIYDG